jgi:hypothetical protein
MKNKKNKTKSKSSRKRIYRILSRLYAELRANDTTLIFKKIRVRKNAKGKREHMVGTYNWNAEDEMEIDYRYEILSTIVHEFLHKWYPYQNEKWILSEEARIMNAITVRQFRNYVRVLAEVV